MHFLPGTCFNAFFHLDYMWSRNFPKCMNNFIEHFCQYLFSLSHFVILIFFCLGLFSYMHNFVAQFFICLISHVSIFCLVTLPSDWCTYRKCMNKTMYNWKNIQTKKILDKNVWYEICKDKKIDKINQNMENALTKNALRKLDQTLSVWQNNHQMKKVDKNICTKKKAWQQNAQQNVSKSSMLEFQRICQLLLLINMVTAGRFPWIHMQNGSKEHGASFKHFCSLALRA